MLKYKISHDNKIVEFLTEQDALNYKNQNNLLEEIEIFQDEIQGFKNVPEEVTPRQFRQALILSGISMQTIEDFISFQPEPIKSLAMIEWEYSTAFLRNNQMMNSLAPAIGFTPSMLDDLWILAETL